MSGGPMCFVKGCNSIQNKEKMIRTSFFSFPRDIERSRTWIKLVGRDDLLERVDTLHKTHRLCAGHFEERMFASNHNNRLLPKAVPTIFPSLEPTSSILLDHNYAVFNLPIIDVNCDTRDPLQELDMNIQQRESDSPPLLSPIYAIDPLQDVDMHLCRKEYLLPPVLFPMSTIPPPQKLDTPTHQEERVLSPLLIPMSTVDYLKDLEVIIPNNGDSPQKLDTNTPEEERVLSPLLIPLSTEDYIEELKIIIPKKEPVSLLNSPTFSDSSSSMSVDTPSKEELWHTIKELQAEVAYLRKNLQIRSETNGIDNITLDQYKTLTHKFVPSKDLANFICAQAKQPKG